MFSHVIRQVVDSGGQDCDLNFWRSRIGIAQLVFLNQLLFTFFRDRHVLPWVLWGKPHAGGFCIDAPNLLRLGLTAIPTCALALPGHQFHVQVQFRQRAPVNNLAPQCISRRLIFNSLSTKKPSCFSPALRHLLLICAGRIRSGDALKCVVVLIKYCNSMGLWEIGRGSRGLAVAGLYA